MNPIKSLTLNQTTICSLSDNSLDSGYDNSKVSNYNADIQHQTNA